MVILLLVTSRVRLQIEFDVGASSRQFLIKKYYGRRPTVLRSGFNTFGLVAALNDNVTKKSGIKKQNLEFDSREKILLLEFSISILFDFLAAFNCHSIK